MTILRTIDGVTIEIEESHDAKPGSVEAVLDEIRRVASNPTVNAMRLRELVQYELPEAYRAERLRNRRLRSAWIN